jgi:hypothetical protein
MISRYQIVRGKRTPNNPLPRGERQDTRKHTRHLLRPLEASVLEFLDNPTELGFQRFRKAYLSVLAERWRSERAWFDMLAALARTHDVFLGCNCASPTQPNVRHCHTWLALEFLAKAYPDLNVVFP